MFFNKPFLIYLPKLNKYVIIKAKDEAEAVWKLCNNFLLSEEKIENYKILTNYFVIK